MRRYEYSDEIVNVVKQFLEKDKWNYSFDEDTGIFRFNLKVKSKIQRIRYIIDVHEDSFITFGIAPFGVDCEDDHMMAQMAEFICLANYGKPYGCFELCFKDGDIRFKCYVDCQNRLPSTEIVRNSVHCVVAMFDHYASGIVDIIFNSTSSAKDAFAKCEESEEVEQHPDEDEILAALDEALGGDVSEEAVGAFLSRLASELGISEDSDGDHEDDDRPKGIRLNPFADGDGSGSDQPHIRMDLFAAEGGEA